MRIFSKITRTEIEASPIVDGSTGKLLGFQENEKGPLMPVELYVIPYSIDWRRVRHETLMAILPGVASRFISLASANARISQVNYPTEQAIVEEATKITDEVVRMLQEQDDSFFSAGAEAIRKERSRQVLVEGYDIKHDAGIEPGMFFKAAIAYLKSALKEDDASEWPFDAEFFKPKDEIRDAERAGALIAAALDQIYKRPKEKKTKTTKK